MLKGTFGLYAGLGSDNTISSIPGTGKSLRFRRQRHTHPRLTALANGWCTYGERSVDHHGGWEICAHTTILQDLRQKRAGGVLAALSTLCSNLLHRPQDCRRCLVWHHQALGRCRRPVLITVVDVVWSYQGSLSRDSGHSLEDHTLTRVLQPPLGARPRRGPVMSRAAED